VNKELKKIIRGSAPMVHTYNPRYSEGRDQEDYGLKPTRANNL
jgi:hypothetical protein